MKKRLAVLMVLILAGAGFAQTARSADKQYLMDAVSVSGLLEAEAAYENNDKADTVTAQLAYEF